MLVRILVLLLLASASVHGKALTGGMSLEDVQVELGRPESTIELGSREILIYADGTRLEFFDGKLMIENDRVLHPPETQKQNTPETGEPLIKAEEIVQQREGKTIGASVQGQNVDSRGLGRDYKNKSSELEKLGADIDAEAMAGEPDDSSPKKNLLQAIAIAFGIEMVVTLVVLGIAFQVSGFPTAFAQLALLSLAVALASALLETLLRLGPLSPLRSVAGFIVLILLIRPLTDVREWATVIKIAIIARLVSVAVLWLTLVGLSTLFRI